MEFEYTFGKKWGNGVYHVSPVPNRYLNLVHMRIHVSVTIFFVPDATNTIH